MLSCCMCETDCRHDTSLLFLTRDPRCFGNKSVPWGSTQGGKLVSAWLMRKVTGLQNKKGWMMSSVWGLLYRCKTILVWFAVIWFVSVCVIWCVTHSQGKDLLPLQLLSSSIINTARNHRGPRWPSVPWMQLTWLKDISKAGQCIVCVSSLEVCAFNVSNFSVSINEGLRVLIHSFCS